MHVNAIEDGDGQAGQCVTHRCAMNGRKLVDSLVEISEGRPCRLDLGSAFEARDLGPRREPVRLLTTCAQRRRCSSRRIV